MTFAPLTTAQLPAVAAIAATAPDPWRRADLADALADEKRLCLVALAGERPVGFACLRLDAGSTELEMIAVAPALQGQGIGKALLRAALAEAKHHAPRCLLEVRTGNTAAIALYEGLGFQALAQRPGLFSNPPGDGLMMELVF